MIHASVPARQPSVAAAAALSSTRRRGSAAGGALRRRGTDPRPRSCGCSWHLPNWSFSQTYAGPPGAVSGRLGASVAHAVSLSVCPYKPRPSATSSQLGTTSIASSRTSPAGSPGRRSTSCCASPAAASCPPACLAYRLRIRNILVAAVAFYDDEGQPGPHPMFLQFPADPLLRGQRVLIVDEVWESGTTIHAVTERVVQAGGIPTTAVRAQAPAITGPWRAGPVRRRDGQLGRVPVQGGLPSRRARVARTALRDKRRVSAPG